jgi:uncharacterized membrane protein
MCAVIAACILGSRVNIPLVRFSDRRVIRDLYIVVLGVLYRMPVIRHTGRQVLAINVGGAIIPTGLACYLTVHLHVWEAALIATTIVAPVVWLVARPDPGVGIVTPAFVPPIAAALSAILVTQQAVAAVAFVCGTIGTLVGADLLNVRRIRDLGAPVASIGGAGTFDGIFLTGILAVLLAV